MKVERVSIAGAGKPEPVTVSDVPASQGAARRADEPRLSATPTRAGLYELTLDGDRTTRVAAVPEREIDLRPRKVENSARGAHLGGVASSLDASPYVALALLALLAGELALRVVGLGRETAAER